MVDADDAAAFEQFVRQRAASLPRIAALLVGDVQFGEDLVQEVLASLSRRWGAVRTVDNLDAYVHRALVNTATSWRRRRSWYEVPTIRLPSAHTSPRAMTTPRCARRGTTTRTLA